LTPKVLLWSGEVLPQILASEDAIEGMMSFTERRDAAFKGK
jgi:hypothetical protein